MVELGLSELSWECMNVGEGEVESSTLLVVDHDFVKLTPVHVIESITSEVSAVEAIANQAVGDLGQLQVEDDNIVSIVESRSERIIDFSFLAREHCEILLSRTGGENGDNTTIVFSIHSTLLGIDSVGDCEDGIEEDSAIMRSSTSGGETVCGDSRRCNRFLQLSLRARTRSSWGEGSCGDANSRGCLGLLHCAGIGWITVRK